MQGRTPEIGDDYTEANCDDDKELQFDDDKQGGYQSSYQIGKGEDDEVLHDTEPHLRKIES